MNLSMMKIGVCNGQRKEIKRQISHKLAESYSCHELLQQYLTESPTTLQIILHILQ
jgi:hypothetical protein